MKFDTLHLLIAVTALTFAPAAFAYLDPGTGSMIVSAIVGLFASIALAVKTYWYRLVGFLRRVFRGGSSARADTPDRDEAPERDPSGRR